MKDANMPSTPALGEDNNWILEQIKQWLSSQQSSLCLLMTKVTIFEGFNAYAPGLNSNT